MSSRHRIGAALAVLLVLGSACNSKLLRPPAIVFVDGGEYAVETSLDEKGYRFPSVLFAYLPSGVPLHPGDALNFSLRDTGEPHTIAMGRIIDRAVSTVEVLGATATLKDIEKLSSMKKVPSVLPHTSTGAVPAINQSASEPCFLDDGLPPVAKAGGAPACAEAKQPAFDGAQSFYSSGVLKEGEPFRVKLSRDIKPASYRFMCLVHRSAMTGTIEVVPPDQDRPTVAQLRKSADDEEREIAGTLQPPARDAIRREGGPVLAGTGPRGITRGEMAAFFPRDETAQVGRPLGWRFYGTHSISFKPDRDAKEGVLIEKDGSWQANPDAWKPIGSPALPKSVFGYPPSTKPVSIDGGTWDGEDPFSSGIIRAVPPAPVAYTLRFSKAGTFKYQCLVHPAMRGQIEVR